MNVGEIKDQYRRASGDLFEPYLCNDDEILIHLNEATDEAAKRSFLLKTSDMSVGETQASGTLTISGSTGSISSIIIDGKNIITNPVSYTGNDSVTAQILAAEINSTYLFEAKAVSNVVTIKPLAGSGAYFNNAYPIITQSPEIATPTIISGGIDGICRTTFFPNKKEYKFSQRILKFENFFIGEMTKQPYLRNYRFLSEHELAAYSKAGNVDSIIYGMSNDSFIVGSIPNKKGFIQATVYYKPLHKLVKNTDIPEIPEEFHSKLIDYILHKVYLKNDAEIEGIELSNKHLAIFEKEFNDSLFTSAFQQKNDLGYFFGDSTTLNSYNW